jgi:hypothetical protein
MVGNFHPNGEKSGGRQLSQMNKRSRFSRIGITSWKPNQKHDGGWTKLESGEWLVYCAGGRCGAFPACGARGNKCVVDRICWVGAVWYSTPFRTSLWPAFCLIISLLALLLHPSICLVHSGFKRGVGPWFMWLQGLVPFRTTGRVG